MLLHCQYLSRQIYGDMLHHRIQSIFTALKICSVHSSLLSSTYGNHWSFLLSLVLSFPKCVVGITQYMAFPFSNFLYPHVRIYIFFHWKSEPTRETFNSCLLVCAPTGNRTTTLQSMGWTLQPIEPHQPGLHTLFRWESLKAVIFQLAWMLKDFLFFVGGRRGDQFVSLSHSLIHWFL